VIAPASQRVREQAFAPASGAGCGDSAGSSDADILPSQESAQTVADALVASGVAADLVHGGRGQTGGNLVLASRRIEITLAAN